MFTHDLRLHRLRLPCVPVCQLKSSARSSCAMPVLQRHSGTWVRSAILKRYVGLRIFMGESRRGDPFCFLPRPSWLVGKDIQIFLPFFAGKASYKILRVSS